MSDRLHDATGGSLGLERAIDELRGEVHVREAWRARLERALSDAAPAAGGTRGRRWSMHPAMAMAAALGFMVLGGVGSSLLQQRTLAGGNIASGTTMVRQARAEPSDIGVRFAVVAPGVTRVSLVGDFNGWDPKATPLSLARDGRTWSIMLPLSSGRHTYAFVIDDEIVADPAAPPAIEDDFGTPSSFVLVANDRP